MSSLSSSSLLARKNCCCCGSSRLFHCLFSNISLFFRSANNNIVGRTFHTHRVVAMAERPTETTTSTSHHNKHTNRLAAEHSPYLLQHAHNPVISRSSIFNLNLCIFFFPLRLLNVCFKKSKGWLVSVGRRIFCWSAQERRVHLLIEYLSFISCLLLINSCFLSFFF